MEDVIIVDEKYSKYWIWAMLIGIVFSLLLFTISKNTSNVVLGNYLQLGAFISFAATIFAVIKLWEGKKSIRLMFEDDSLVVDIYKEQSALQRDRYDLNRVQNIYLVPSKISVPFLNIFINRKDAATFQLLLNGEDQPFYLFQFSGRIISVSNDAAERLSAFLNTQELDVLASN